jgi:hypothetical protein
MPSPQRSGATTSPDSPAQVWQTRTDLVKQEMAAANAAVDAKTARLKALRLEKEAKDAETARLAENDAPPAPVKKTRVKRGT